MARAFELVDTHCHLDFPEFDPDRESVIERAKAAGVSTLVNIGSSIAGSRASVALAAAYGCIHATVGIHPHEADRADQAAIDELRVLAKSDKVVAIGEIGLDYYRNYSQAGNQRRLFAAQIAVAQECDKPLVIHCRQAEHPTQADGSVRASAQADILSILHSHLPLRAVVHCFSGDEQFLDACLEAGLFVSFTCNITYRKADTLRRMAARVPLERLMLETDAPFLSPEGSRGKRNEPAQVKLLAESIAALRGIAIDELARETTRNAREFFRLS